MKRNGSGVVAVWAVGKWLSPLDRFVRRGYHIGPLGADIVGRFAEDPRPSREVMDPPPP